MKKALIVFSIILGISPCVFAQTNTFPSSGNVGIGTTSPQALLDVQGQMRLGKTGSAGRIDFARPGDGNYQGSLGWATDEIFRQYFSGGGSSYRISSYINNQLTDVVTVSNSGYVGIGTTSPEAAFHVNGESRFNGTGWFSRNNNGGQSIALRLGQNQNWDHPAVEISTMDYNGTSESYWLGTRWGHHVKFQRSSSAGTKTMVQLGGTDGMHYISVFSTDGSTEKIRFVADGTSWMSGNVGIGTTAPGPYKLAVEGTIGARKVKVTQVNPWADYVFNDDYPLLPLNKLEKYIQQNKHLPDVPSATEVEKNGLDLGENQAVLLKKIEELTLYVIEQNKKMEYQQKQIAELQNSNEKLKKQAADIEKLTQEIESLKKTLSK